MSAASTTSSSTPATDQPCSRSSSFGFLCVGGALIAEFVFGVPWWAHVLLWGILTPLIAVFLLRFLKATLIALQFKNKAEEGRLSKE